MAKQVMLIPENNILRQYRRQALMNPPEVTELNFLDEKLTKILTRTDIGIKEKAFQYYMLLQKYQNLYKDYLDKRHSQKRKTTDSIVEQKSKMGVSTPKKETKPEEEEEEEEEEEKAEEQDEEKKKKNGNNSS